MVSAKGIFRLSLISLVCIAIVCTNGYALNPLIVGGREADSGEWPWMAALVRKGLDPVYGQFCGGSLIESQWVITAAHCLTDVSPDSVEVLIGIHDLETDTDFERAQIETIYLHPAFETDYDTAIDADIALIRLKTPVTGYETIALNRDLTLSAPGVISTVIGWGSLYYGGPYPAVLQQVELPVVSLGVAENADTYDLPLTPDMLPAGFAEGGKDACIGDSGGPLMVPDAVGVAWELAGLVSFGNGCAEPHTYGIYSRVSYFYDWVQNHVFSEYIQEGAVRIIGMIDEEDSTDLSRTDGLYYMEEILWTAPAALASHEIQIKVAQGAFIPHLVIVNDTTGRTLRTFGENTQSELRFTFTAEPDDQYRFRISSASPEKTGTFYFNSPLLGSIDNEEIESDDTDNVHRRDSSGWCFIGMLY